MHKLSWCTSTKKIALSQNTDLEQYTILKLFKEKLKGTLVQI